MPKLLSMLLLTTLLAAPVQAQKLSDAFIDTKERAFRKQFVNLAMMPVVAAPSAALPAAIQQLISDEVLEILDDEDFKVLAPQQAKSIQDELAALYPASPTEADQAAIADHTVRELFFQHPVDGLVVVNVLPVAAPFRDDKAEWGGTSQKIEHKGDGFFGSIMGKDYGGHIAASAIRIAITDRAGKTVYYWSGGVEVMMQRNGDKLEPLPTEDLWQDEKRVIKAVKYALKPL